MAGGYKFVSKGSYSPGTLPMERLALYLAAFVRLAAGRFAVVGIAAMPLPQEDAQAELPFEDDAPTA